MTKYKVGKNPNSRNGFKDGHESFLIKHSEKAKKKISKNNCKYWLGKNRSEETKLKIGKGNKNKEISIESRLKMSQVKKGKKTGKNNPNWKGGITKKNLKIRKGIEFRLWRESVFTRDNWTCQKCKIKGEKLNAHHICNFADYPELQTSIENGITFCQKAHKEFHKIYGKKNNTKEQLEEFLYYDI